MASPNPRVSVSQISTLHASSRTIQAYVVAGLDGIGIWELKLGEGPDDAALAAFERSPLGRRLRGAGGAVDPAVAAARRAR